MRLTLMVRARTARFRRDRRCSRVTGLSSVSTASASAPWVCGASVIISSPCSLSVSRTLMVILSLLQRESLCRALLWRSGASPNRDEKPPPGGGKAPPHATNRPRVLFQGPANAPRRTAFQPVFARVSRARATNLDSMEVSLSMRSSAIRLAPASSPMAACPVASEARSLAAPSMAENTF